MKEPIDLKIYQGDVYRNFATLHPTQELMDDLVDNKADQEILKRYYYKDDATVETKTERVLNKSSRQIVQDEISAKFNPKNWYATRYSDGGWPVLYTAESAKTALKEALYHVRNFYKEEIAVRPISIDRRVVRLTLDSLCCADICSKNDFDQSQVVSIDPSGYAYCQELARELRLFGAALLRAPSARDEDGVCVAIFDKMVIAKDHGHVKYLKCVLSATDTVVYVETLQAFVKNN